jgi:hypothetical protein
MLLCVRECVALGRSVSEMRTKRGKDSCVCGEETFMIVRQCTVLGNYSYRQEGERECVHANVSLLCKLNALGVKSFPLLNLNVKP